MNQETMQQFVHSAAPIQVVQEVSTLIDQCCAAMRSVGISEDRIAIMSSDNMVFHAKKLGLNDQRYALNLFWQVQLGPFKNDAVRARGSLINAGNEADWIAYFTSKVIPLIIDNDLPFTWEKLEQLSLQS